MRPAVFSANLFHQFLRRQRLAATEAIVGYRGRYRPFFRKLKDLGYRTSYSHRGSFYTLDEIAGFDKRGLWSFDSVWLSRHSTLLATARTSASLRPRLAAMA
jgi:hypothetical protein